MFFIIEKKEETTIDFSLNSASIVYIMENQRITNLLKAIITKLKNLFRENGVLLMIKILEIW